MFNTTHVLIAKGVKGYTCGVDQLWVPAGATVAQLLAVLQAPTATLQHYTINRNQQPLKAAARLQPEDQLQVQDAEGRQAAYQLAFNETPQAGWDVPGQLQVESAVNAHLPIIPRREVSLLDPRFADLIDTRDERYAIGNTAGDPADTAAPLAYATQQVTYYGAAINAAIAWLNQQGGGVLTIPAAKAPYYTGAIRLLSHVCLQVANGATVKFMREPTNEYYPVVLTSYEGNDLLNFSPCVYALGQHDIAICGGGVLDGQEDMYNWRPWKKGYWGCDRVDDPSVDADYGNNGRLNAQNFNDVPVAQRLYTADGQLPKQVYTLVAKQPQLVAPVATKAYRSAFRPNFIEFNHCQNVVIAGVKIRHTPFWAVHPLNSQHVLVHGIDLYSNRTKDFEDHGWNNDDGIDPESCQQVVIAHCHVIVSDDGVAIKAGRNRDGMLRRQPCVDLVIRDSYFGNDGGGSAAISVGSEMSAGVKRVYVQQCAFGGVGLSQLLKLKTNAIRGGYIQDVYVRQCRVQAVSRGLVQIDADYRETVPFAHADSHLPQINNINLTDIVTAEDLQPSVNLIDLASSMANSPACGITLRRVAWHTPQLARELQAFDAAPYLRNVRLIAVLFIDEASCKMQAVTTKPPLLQGVTLSNRNGAWPINALAADQLAAGPLTVTGQFYQLPQTTALTASLTLDGQLVACRLQANGDLVSDAFELSAQRQIGRSHRLAINVQGGLLNQTWCYELA